jgi:rRNA maturation RNase YbeY
MGNNIGFYGKCRFLNGTDRQKIRTLLQQIANNHRFEIDSLSYIYVSDDELLEMNQRVLDHDTYTDIITFDLSDMEGRIDGEIYISKDRVQENSVTFNTTFELENIRVLSHGLLHLIGFKDKSEIDIKEMREQEDLCIEIYNKM